MGHAKEGNRATTSLTSPLRNPVSPGTMPLAMYQTTFKWGPHSPDPSTEAKARSLYMCVSSSTVPFHCNNNDMNSHAEAAKPPLPLDVT